jgi:16S rRNA C967 or C1407 C5-methylase (RsmB/RsmF family)
MNIKNCEFLPCLLYTNTKEEIIIYRNIEKIIYNEFPEYMIKNYKKDLEELGHEAFVKKISFIESKELEYNNIPSRKNVKDIMLESYAIKNNKTKAEFEKLKMYILLKKIPGKHIIFENGEITNIID